MTTSRPAHHPLRRFSALLRGSNSLPVVLFCTFFTYGLIYRARLFLRVAEEQAIIMADGSNVFHLFQFLIQELFLALAILLASGAVLALGRIKRFDPLRGPLKWPGRALLHLLILLAGFIYATHFSLTFALRTGFTLDMLIELLSTNSFLAMRGDTNPSDYAFIALLFGIFWLYRLLPARVVVVRNMLLVALSACVLILALVQDSQNKLIASELKENPLIYTIKDFAHGMGRRKQAAADRARSGAGGPAERQAVSQAQSVALVHPDFSGGRPVRAAQSGSGRRKWNLVYIVLESTGAEYVFNTNLGNRMPMPFTKSIADKSLHLERHFSTANTSPRSLFSIFSGLYPMPQLRMFVTRKNVRIPSIMHFLGKDYSSFLVTPGGLDWFFPLGFFKHAGMKLYGFNDIPIKNWGRSPSNGRNEAQTVGFFLDELKRTSEPFVAVYYSYVAHWPYFDYGREYDVFAPHKPKIHRLLYRYYNNLRLMDTQIERIFKQLEETGILDNTIVIITGDHGEAFGKHHGNWIHSRDSFNENYRVPMIIYQPRLFKPRKIHDLTLHIDIMPTLLDAMGIAYNPELIQGESLFTRPFRRKFSFLYGNERTISSISRNNIKLQIALKSDKCWVYDLASDPDEFTRLGCKDHSEQKRILLHYMEQQKRILSDYNKSLKKSLSYHGKRHPIGE